MADRIAPLEGKLESERAPHEVELAILRHSVGNSNTCLDAILPLLEAAPEKAADHAAKIRKMSDDMRDRKEREKSHFAATKTAAAAILTGRHHKDEPRRGSFDGALGRYSGESGCAACKRVSSNDCRWSRLRSQLA